MLGQTLGHYRLVEKIGAGGMGVVYRARDERLDRDVAVKVLPAGAFADEEMRTRFRKEALALSRLNHPNVATIHDFNTEGGVDFLAMEYISGATLAEMRPPGGLPEPEIVRLGRQAAEALEAAHDQGLIHRDLKPGNIMVTPKGLVKLLDFGLAKLLRPSGPADKTLTFAASESFSGTLAYMAPEQLEGRPTDQRTDIHALGIVFMSWPRGRSSSPRRPRPGSSRPSFTGSRRYPPRSIRASRKGWSGSSSSAWRRTRPTAMPPPGSSSATWGASRRGISPG
jgi:serine/threonine protein kinase